MRQVLIKRIVIIFIIAFCLLSFIEISFLAEEPYNYGKFWNSMSDGEKCAYISGLHAGMAKCICDLIEIMELILEKNMEIPEEAEEKATDLVFETHHLLSPDFEVRVRAISDLYKDPANAYIPIAEINILAHRKIRGESIEPLLREARKKALP